MRHSCRRSGNRAGSGGRRPDSPLLRRTGRPKGDDPTPAERPRLGDLRDGLLELVDAERTLEALDDLAGLVDHERPRLRLQPELGELRADALVRVVVDVDLVVDEGDVGLRLGLD